MYPLKFEPLYQQRIWGGAGLADHLRKTLPPTLRGKAVGESWELADLPPGAVKADSAGAGADGSFSSVISNGPWRGQTLREALAAHGTQIMGQRHGGGGVEGRFPLLIKFLDARTDLSVQVHPHAQYVAENPGTHIKSEAWYILHAQPGAKIYKGIKPGVDRAAFRAAIECGDVADLLNAIPARAGDCHYLPSGTVHALGAGILAAEVQTPSDTTFRVFDWNRVGADGKPRKLHIEEALATANFDGGDHVAQAPRRHIAGVFSTVTHLVACEYFTLERVRLTEAYEQEIPYHEPVVWIVLEGQGVITCDQHAQPVAFTKGETLLLPAGLKNAKVRTVTDCGWLEAKLPPSAAL